MSSHNFQHLTNHTLLCVSLTMVWHIIFVYEWFVLLCLHLLTLMYHSASRKSPPQDNQTRMNFDLESATSPPLIGPLSHSNEVSLENSIFYCYVRRASHQFSGLWRHSRSRQWCHDNTNQTKRILKLKVLPLSSIVTCHGPLLTVLIPYSTSGCILERGWHILWFAQTSCNQTGYSLFSL
jgi:hypothetical protein